MSDYDLQIEAMIKEMGADKAPRVTLDSINAKIDTVLYMRDATTAFTVCKIGLKNGFQFVGTSGAASPENYRQEIGDKIAYDNAFKQIWSHEGYLLKELLYLHRTAAEMMKTKERLEPIDLTDTQAALGQKAVG